MTAETKFVVGAEDRTARAFASVKAGLSGLQRQAQSTDASLAALNGGFAGVTRLAGSLAALAGGGIVLGQVRSAINQLAALDDASAETGASVEALSSLLNTLAPTGVGLEQITDLAGRITQAMRQAETATSEQAEAFRKLNVATKDATGFRDSASVAFDLAKALDQYAEGGNKAALVQDLLGKKGGQYVPMLKDLAQFTREAASATSEQAQKAADLQDAIGRITTSIRMLRDELVAGLAPAFSDFAQRYVALARLGRGPVDMLDGLFGDDPQAKIAGFERRIEDLTRIRKQLAESGDPSIMQRALNPSLRTRDDIDRELIDLAGKLESARQVKREMDKIFGTGPSRPKPQAPSPTSGGSGKAGKADRGAEDFEARINQSVSRLVEGSAAVKARELEAVLGRLNTLAAQGLDPEVWGSALEDVFKGMAQAGVPATDLLERLDVLFFDLGLSAERYDEIQKEVFKTTAEAGKDGGANLEQLAEKWRGLVDPTHKYLLELQEVQKLIDAGPQYEALARKALASIGQRSAEELNGTKDSADDAKDAAKELGLTFTSAFEDAVVGGKGLRDILDGIEQDVMRIVTRNLVTKPLANAVSGMAENLLGSMMGGIRFGPPAPISASTATFVRSADGNVMTEFGPLPLRKHAHGGVGYSPMVSIFAEGGMPEAYVPLPDGRSIPVTVDGGARGDIVFYITTPDVESFRRSEGQIKARLAGWSAGSGRYR